MVSSYTNGIDAYDEGDNGDSTLEEAYLAIRGLFEGELAYDLSLGARELKLGSGMLIANGASSGFERGALKFGPRKAWETAVIARISQGGFNGTVFYIDPNELPSTDGKNKLAGLDFRYDDPQGGYLGVTMLDVLESASPYVQAAPGGLGAPTILPGARDGTRAINLYGKTTRFTGVMQNWVFSTDLAYQWNEEINLEAWAGRITAGYNFTQLPWMPSLNYSFQTFSGDDPGTSSTLERFDPLYYEGSPSAWVTGSKSQWPLSIPMSTHMALPSAFSLPGVTG